MLQGLTATANRYAPIIKWTSIALIALGVLLILRQLPIGSGLQALEGWITKLGMWGPVVYGLIYVIAVVLLVPGSALTLTAGAMFGLAVGTITVSLAATTGSALAFLISRYLARAAIARKIERYPKFHAIDRAISAGGWKIVALLRLSPAVPFNLQNYLYGLTGIPFWTCVLTSWVTMLPGGFLYIYLGHLGRAGLEATAGGQEKTPAEWAMLIVGLLATIAVSVYVTRLARRALQTSPVFEPSEAGVLGPSSLRDATRGLWGATLSAVLALAVLGLSLCLQLNPDLVKHLFGRWLGPPRVVLDEAYSAQAEGPSFDHALFDQLLKSHVDPDGGVDYQGLQKEAGKLDRYLQSLSYAPFDDMGRDQKLALLINAYNAFTLRLILDHYPLESIEDIPPAKRWDDERWRIGAYRWSLAQIEHEQIRPKFKEPRIHFALVCAAVGCPKLRNQAYQADRLEQQLEDQARTVHRPGRWFGFDRDKNVARLTPLYWWYHDDFEQVTGSVLNYASRYSTELKQALDAGAKPKIEWLEYDWSLNSKENARK